jgi:hypothetical protein
VEAGKALEQVLELYREKYFDFNVRHFHEEPSEEHGVALARFGLGLQTGRRCCLLRGVAFVVQGGLPQRP